MRPRAADLNSVPVGVIFMQKTASTRPLYYFAAFFKMYVSSLWEYRIAEKKGEGKGNIEYSTRNFKYRKEAFLLVEAGNLLSLWDELGF